MNKKISTFTYKAGRNISSVEKEYNIKNVIKLASNENPIGPSPNAIRNANKKINELNRYPDSDSLTLKLQLVKKFKKKSLTIDNLIVGNGSNEILDFAARAYLSSDSEVIFAKHSFLVYRIVANIMNAKIIETSPIKLKSKQYLGTDLSAILEKINKKTRLIFIANPNNPTGTILDIEEIDSFMKNISKKIIVVLDEAYAEYAEYQKKYSGLSILEKYPNLIVTRTFSKIYALAGLRVGYGIGSKKIIKTLNYYRHPFNVNTFAQLLAAECLKDKKYISKSLKDNAAGMNYIKNEFDKLGIDYLGTYGNFLTFKLGSRAINIYNKLLANGIIVRPLDNYDLKDYLRITVGKDNENRRFISTLKKVLKNNKNDL